MASSVKLLRLTVIANATQQNVSGKKNWAAVKKRSEEVIVEATTAQRNNIDEWKQIVWSGDKGESVPGRLNRRKLSLSNSRKHHCEATLGGVRDYVDLWVLWASVDIIIQGSRPVGSASFDPGTRDKTDKLGAVLYKSITASVIDEKAGRFVDNMGASAKVAPVATLTPKGVNKVIKGGFTFLRQVWSHNWSDGVKTEDSNKTWTKDTSNARYQRLIPDTKDKIYDLDAPDIRWGQRSYETYNNFRQWIEWNLTKCSDYALWYWRARWKLHKDITKQITLNDLNKGNINLPTNPFYPPSKSP
jgi:hypothetical protein